MTVTADHARHALMKEAFAALDIDDAATYRMTIAEGSPVTVLSEDEMPGTTVRALLRAQTWLASGIEQDATGRIDVRLAGQIADRKRACTFTKVCEFIIVGQCQGTGYTLWDIAPAPTNPARRAAVLEEIGVDAADAFGSVSTERGATPREALDKFLADMREQSGLDEYGLTADSQTGSLDEAPTS
ncbi:hypothetical protein ACIQMV_19130 [Streptomyces sp. NPDC091412]|uniref:hypothetical protein n=1 Tax=Streptomyces sp. NPDC091412 TaxID=3366002 RepID=UPI0038033CFC